jgi:hypothetical protein
MALLSGSGIRRPSDPLVPTTLRHYRTMSSAPGPGSLATRGQPERHLRSAALAVPAALDAAGVAPLDQPKIRSGLHPRPTSSPLEKEPKPLPE